ncbi:hypothetical protein EV383_6269 [Pseudonocardia sediminis]|uniref:Uncharacterized protein n=1 Tax=Pseudonocardia sediminis TaxID=1397368 RepID=A0A4Q7U7Q4_PSEST|nr:Rv3235 family protein [Pseudonocardia sediminis]RZT75528.1 hypothetical protein EV383_6269 [Pseudonocardia sediminis]
MARTQNRPGSLWRVREFQTQLLPGDVPMLVTVTERYDPAVAARHAKAAAAQRCPHCRGDLSEPVPDELAATPRAYFAGEPTSGVAADSDLEIAARRAMAVVFEAIDGRRPVTQLNQLADPAVVRYVRAQAGALRGQRVPSRIYSCHVRQPWEGIGEVFGLARVGSRRVAAFASRVELRPAGWRIGALRVL